MSDGLDFFNELLAGLDPTQMLKADAIALVASIAELFAPAERPSHLVVGLDTLALIEREVEPSGYDDLGTCHGLPLVLYPELMRFGVVAMESPL